ncbi:MAG: adenylate/guanylate cyclase domain-containing protein [Mycobacterium sp.]
MDGGPRASIDELLDRALRGGNPEHPAARTPADEDLAPDFGEPDDGDDDLLGGVDNSGEIRRLTLMFIDLVDSTALSTRVEPETYRTLVSSYRTQAARFVEHYEGHLTSTKGDGLLAVFGHPRSHEDDTHRAVAAALDIARLVSQFSEQAEQRYGVRVEVRIGVHRGLVYLDTVEDDVYGFAANFASRISSLAGPGEVTVSDALAALVGDAFELIECPAALVKGVDTPVTYHRVIGERPHAPPAPSTPLIGRSRERSWLQRAWGAVSAAQPTGAAVAFRGEAGIGKTRLVRSVTDAAEAAGAAVVELRGSPLHTGSGLHPVRRLLERRCGFTRFTDDAERFGLLRAEIDTVGLDPAEMLPLLAPILDIGPEHGYQPAAAEGLSLYQMVNAGALRYVLSCAASGPGLLVAEDVHWYDPSTLELLDAVLMARDDSLLVVLTGRDGSWLRPHWPVQLFDLGPLGPRDCDALVDVLCPDATMAQRLTVRYRCDGVPFYIEHLAGMLRAENPHAGVPEALYDPLFTQLNTRSAALPVLEAAAIIGRSGDIPLLGAVLDPATALPQHLDDVVGELFEARVLEPSGTDGWRFRHELFRDVAAEISPPSRRRDLHARTAEALVAARGAQPDWRVVAEHYAQAERPTDAVAGYRKAADAARRRGALLEAVGCLTDALTQLGACAASRERDLDEIAIRLARGFLVAATVSATTGEGPADLERCLQLATAGGYDEQLLTTLITMLGYYMPRAELRSARDLLESLPARIGAADRRWTHPVLTSSLGTVWWLEGRFDAAEECLRDAVARCADADPGTMDAGWMVTTDPIAVAHTYLALTHVLRADVAGARAAISEAERRCAELTFPRSATNRAHTYFKEIWVCLEGGRLEEAADLASAMHRCAEDAGIDMWKMVAGTQHITVRGLTALAAGADADTLRRRADRLSAVVDAARGLQLHIYLTYHDGVIARLLLAAGLPALARERIDMSLRLAEESGMRFEDAELLRLRAHTLDQPGERLQALDIARGRAREQGATLFELRCLLDHVDFSGKPDKDVRAALADLVAGLPADPALPEWARAQRILR